MSKHTPGPWRMKKSTIGNGNFLITGQSSPCNMIFVNAHHPRAKENAALVLYAPELLASAKACESILKNTLLPILEIAHPDLVPGFKKSIETLGLVIQKAEGDS